MKLFRKLVTGTAVVLSSVMALTGCASSFSYTYNVETGDAVKVELDTSNGLKLKNDKDNSHFKVLSKDGEELCDGGFDYEDKMEQQGEYIASYEGAEGLNVYSNTDDLLYYDFTDENGTVQLERLIKVSDNTCVIITSTADREDAETAFDALTIGLAE